MRKAIKIIPLFILCAFLMNALKLRDCFIAKNEVVKESSKSTSEEPSDESEDDIDVLADLILEKTPLFIFTHFKSRGNTFSNHNPYQPPILFIQDAPPEFEV